MLQLEGFIGICRGNPYFCDGFYCFVFFSRELCDVRKILKQAWIKNLERRSIFVSLSVKSDNIYKSYD